MSDNVDENETESTTEGQTSEEVNAKPGAGARGRRVVEKEEAEEFDDLDSESGKEEGEGLAEGAEEETGGAGGGKQWIAREKTREEKVQEIYEQLKEERMAAENAKANEEEQKKTAEAEANQQKLNNSFSDQSISTLAKACSAVNSPVSAMTFCMLLGVPNTAIVNAKLRTDTNNLADFETARGLLMFWREQKAGQKDKDLASELDRAMRMWGQPEMANLFQEKFQANEELLPELFNDVLGIETPVEPEAQAAAPDTSAGGIPSGNRPASGGEVAVEAVPLGGGLPTVTAEA